MYLETWKGGGKVDHFFPFSFSKNIVDTNGNKKNPVKEMS